VASGQDLGPTEGDSLIERVAALKHDLGKYVAWTSANLEDRVWTGPLVDELIDALRADLLETRKSGARRDTAWEVWAAHRVGLPDPLEPELELVAAGVAVLERVGPALREPAQGEQLGEDQRASIARERPNIRAAQQDIRNALRDLHRRLLRER
jgi:hypothetical protein